DATFLRPPQDLMLPEKVKKIRADIEKLRHRYPQNEPVLVNLLPACGISDLERCTTLEQIYEQADANAFPDLAYALAAVDAGIPLINFTSNVVELPPLIAAAREQNIPLCGRDGKTGQTYLKVVLASAFKARNMRVDGWYSLNILGNEDGRNLADPARAAGKLANKTALLQEILGPPHEKEKSSPFHKVAIDFYPPRGDAKEAWDVVDFSGIFGLPMSLRMNLQLRDSILAAPLVIDLCWWMAALRKAGRSGPVPELGFYFKKSICAGAPATFQEQLAALGELETRCLPFING
ncbi:MAG: inositol-3-phosphate synthase, partial [Smithellaceae bacterium]|nr:inositol-3-phosphate synthase [Smithellaceae bacterium]